ncbi:spore germination protein [Alkaliphilus metalliredigens QYMF]|uniref:Spore germination protein n=1 Tax=Alkaliphilus metalliredigens (strain QYMF) TaxID=293826 RepID=A6TSP8_ALKMQ|nr:endospore germination permease [Alkaliphilus metalliredigens]ABR49216.1 spore germination protein [Alkaliphilus metalliredigens QYMF]
MDQLNSKHVAFFILATSVVSLKTYPTIYTINGMRESWIAMIIASLLIFLYLVFVIQICNKKNNYHLPNIYTSALGNPLGKFFMLLFIGTLFLTLVEGAAVEANSMHNHMLIDTPVWYFIIFFIVPTLYTVKKGLASIIIVVVIGIVLVMISGINLAILTVKYKTFSYLFPVFERGISLGFVLSILQILGLYGHIAIVFPYLSEVKKKNKLLKHAVIGLLIVIQMQIVSLTGLIQTFDIHVVNQMSYPNLLQTQLVTHFRFLEFGELFVMLQIIGGWYLKYVLAFYALLKLLKEMKLESKYLPYIITVLVGVAAFFAANDLFSLRHLLNYFSYISLINFVVIPFICFTIYAFKGQTAKSSS